MREREIILTLCYPCGQGVVVRAFPRAVNKMQYINQYYNSTPRLFAPFSSPTCSYADAQQQYAAVLDAKRERCGHDSAAVAAAHRDLGRVLALQRQFDRAEEHYAAAVHTCSSLLGEAHPNTACALTDLAAVLREQGE